MMAHDGGGQVVKCNKAALKLLVTDQQLSEAIEPTVSDFDDPSACLFVGVLLQIDGFLAPALHVRNIAMGLHRLLGGRADIAGIRA